MPDSDKSKKEKDFSRSMYDKSKVLEDYGQKTDRLLRSIQKNFENDYTSFCVGAGSIAVIASITLSALGMSEIFSIVLLIMGFTTVIAGVLLRVFATKRKLDSLPQILEFEKERSRVQQQEKLYSRLWFEGKPESLTDEQLNFLLSDNNEVPNNHSQ